MAILDEAVARAIDGDEVCEHLLWEILADYVSDCRDRRSILEYAHEQPAHVRPLDLASTRTRDATREGIDRELKIVAHAACTSRTPDQTPD